MTVENGLRCSTSTAFLYKTGAVNRKNLVIKTGACVTRIIVENQTAVGVEYVQDPACTSDGWKAAYKARAVKPAREKMLVVLSGGAIQTPQILLLSGMPHLLTKKKKASACVACVVLPC
jgi:choline dehydrogenase